MIRIESIRKRIAVLAFVFVAIVAVILYGGKNLNDYNEQQVKNNIDAMMKQNVETVTVMLEQHQNFVESMAKDLSGRTNNINELKRILAQRQKLHDTQHFLRIGFAYPDGNYYGSDGGNTNVCERNYFLRSKAGETVITGELFDKFSPDHKVNIISTPVRNEVNEVEGVIIETFLSDELSDILSRGYFAETGSIAIVNEDGAIVAADHDSTFKVENNDLLGYISLDSGNNNFEKALKNNGIDYMFFERDEGLHLYSAPLHLSGYVNKISLAVLLKQSFLDQQLAFYRQKTMQMLVAIILLLAFAFAYFYYDVRKQHISQRKRLERVAFVDLVTEDNNYAAFIRNMENNDKEGYLMLLSIDNFSIIQSSCGHKRADELLKKINSTIKAPLHFGEQLGHINRGEYAMFIIADKKETLITKIEHINRNLAALADKEETPALVAYFGVIKFAKGEEVREAVNKARVALMTALDNRAEVYAIYGNQYTEDFIYNSNMEKSFEKNIEEKRFEVWYQPKYDPFTNSIMGAEALIRLRGEDGKLIPPYKFIPLFERDGLIRHLDRYVFRSVCEMQKARLDAEQKIVPVSINLSRVSLHYPHIVEEYVNIMKEIGVPVRYVPLEITESATVNSKDICKLLDEFCSNGFRLHMDDFGSGYSSLSSLNVLPFSTIKVDKSIVDYIGEYSGNELIKHVVSLAKRLHLHVTVEGVETKEQVEFLKGINCHSIQGYYFSKPLEYKDFVERLDTEDIKIMG